MATQGSGAAAQNGTKSFELLKAKTRSIPLQEAIALRTQNVGHLEGGPSHSCFFRLELRLTFSVPARVRPSSGLLTACKYRRDRCRYCAVVSRSPCPSRTWIVRKSVPASSKWVAQLWRLCTQRHRRHYLPSLTMSSDVTGSLAIVQQLRPVTQIESINHPT